MEDLIPDFAEVLETLPETLIFCAHEVLDADGRQCIEASN